MKKLLVIIAALALCLGLFGCATKDPGEAEDATRRPTAEATQTQEATATPAPSNSHLTTEEQIEQILPNYSCDLVATTGDSVTSFSYAVRPEAVLLSYDSGDGSILYDIQNSKVYILYPSQKLAYMYTNDTSSFTSPASYLLVWGDEDFSGMQQSSSSVDGRPATVYSVSVFGTEMRYYVDNELGICLAYELLSNNELATKWELKNLQIGSVTMEQVSVPSDYTITDLSGGG